MQTTFDDIGGWPTDDKDLLITYDIAIIDVIVDVIENIRYYY